MKKLIAILVIAGVLFVGAGAVMAGGDKVQKLNPEDLPGTDHNIISHCFQGESSNR